MEQPHLDSAAKKRRSRRVHTSKPGDTGDKKISVIDDPSQRSKTEKEDKERRVGVLDREEKDDSEGFHCSRPPAEQAADLVLEHPSLL